MNHDLLDHLLTGALSVSMVALSVLPPSSTAANSAPAPDRQAMVSGPAYRDGTISAIVEQALLRDKVVPLDAIEVAATPAGDVFLRGRVATLLAIERASKIALAPRGVRSVTNLIELAPGNAVAAGVLKQRILDVLREDPAVQAQQIGVSTTTDGGTVLTGTVGSLAEHTLIDRLVKNVVGVTAVRNDIKVEALPFRRPPELLQTIVEELLQLDAFVDGRAVQVVVAADNTVSLSGRVASDADRRRAIAIAWTTGTTRVRSEDLTVDPSLLE